MIPQSIALTITPRGHPPIRRWAKKFIWCCHICCWGFFFYQCDASTATPMEAVCYPRGGLVWKINLIWSHSMRISRSVYELFGWPLYFLLYGGHHSCCVSCAWIIKWSPSLSRLLVYLLKNKKPKGISSKCVYSIIFARGCGGFLSDYYWYHVTQ